MRKGFNCIAAMLQNKVGDLIVGAHVHMCIMIYDDNRGAILTIFGSFPSYVFVFNTMVWFAL